MENDQISVRDVVGILFLRKWTILSVFVGVVSAASFLCFYMLSPTYEASAGVFINAGQIVIPVTEGAPASDFEKLSSFHTQKDLLVSATIAGKVVNELQLDKQRAIGRIEQFRLWLKEQRRVLGRWLDIKSWQKPEDFRALAIAAVMDNLEIESKPESQVIKVSYRAKDADEAARTLAAILNAYERDFNNRVHERAAGMVDFLESQMTEVQLKLASSERAMLVLKQADRLNLQRGRTQVGAKLPSASIVGSREAPGGDSSDGSLVGITDSTAVQTELKVYVLSMEDELRRLKAEFTDTHPAVTELRDKITRYTQAINDIPRREMELVRLRREMEVNQDAFLFLRKNLERAKIVAGGNVGKMNVISVVDAPEPNEDPVSPKKRLIMVVAVVFGALFSVMIALLQDFLDHTLRSARELQRHLGLKPLGSLGRL